MEFSVIEMILSVGSLKLTSNRQASFGFNTQYALLNDELDSTFRSICEKRQHLHLFLIRDTHEHFFLFNHQRAWSRVSSVIILHGSIFFRFEFTAVYVLWAVSCSCVCSAWRFLFLIHFSYHPTIDFFIRFATMQDLCVYERVFFSRSSLSWLASTHKNSLYAVA